MQFGRRVIWTSEREINAHNIAGVLRNAYPVFSANRSDCDFLLHYDLGLQPIQREKKTRTDIDIQCIDNVANEITVFWTGLMFGNDITLVQRGTNDSGRKNAAEQEAIALLNECYASERTKSKRAELGNYVEITGIGYTITDINTEWEDGDSYFTYNVLDPRYAFVVRSSAHIDHRVVLGVTFREDDNGILYFTCFTPERRYEMYGGAVQNGDYEFQHGMRSGEINPLGKIPITEWIRDYDRTGVWERQIPDMDTLNIAQSDLADWLDQNVQSIWHANDIEFPTEEVETADGTKVEKIKTPKSSEWVQTYTTADGKTPFITPLSVPGDYSGILNNISTKRSWILQKCNVPMRNDTSGGSTGVAMSDATGWSQTEVTATKQESIMEGCLMEEVKLALACVRSSTDIEESNPMTKLRHSDVKPSIKRQKSYELVSKVNAFSVMVSHGIYGLHALNVINLFDDPQQVYEDSKKLIDKYQDSLFNKATNSVSTAPEKAGSDESDQIVNSPNLDGMNRISPDVEESDDGSETES